MCITAHADSRNLGETSGARQMFRPAHGHGRNISPWPYLVNYSSPMFRLALTNRKVRAGDTYFAGCFVVSFP
jgi:hypothetical protein